MSCACGAAVSRTVGDGRCVACALQLLDRESAERSRAVPRQWAGALVVDQVVESWGSGAAETSCKPSAAAGEADTRHLGATVTPLNEMGVEIALPSRTASSADGATLGGVGLGDLRLTGWFGRYGRDRALRLLGRELGELRPRAAPIKGYESAWDVLGDSVVAVTDRPGRESEVHVQLRQSDAEALGWRRARRLVLACETAGDRWQASRLDLNVDQVSGADPKEVVEGALLRHDVVTRTRSVRGSWERVGEQIGYTVYVGARQSDRMLRCYRADVKHPELAAGTTRWELELKADVATHWARRFFGVGDVAKLPVDQVQPLFWSLVRGLVDFVDRGSAGHVEDCKPLDWWAVLTAGAGKARVTAPGLPRQVLRTVAWARRQWAVSLAYLGRELGVEGVASFLEELVVDGDRRLDRQYERHYGAIASVPT